MRPPSVVCIYIYTSALLARFLYIIILLAGPVMRAGGSSSRVSRLRRGRGVQRERRRRVPRGDEGAHLPVVAEVEEERLARRESRGVPPAPPLPSRAAVDLQAQLEVLGRRERGAEL